MVARTCSSVPPRATTPQTDVHDHPQLPAPVLRVGIVGHRPARLLEDRVQVLERVVEDVLALLQGSAIRFAEEASVLRGAGGPVLRALTPLAEGADRVFARRALALGYRLVSVLPFPRYEYERDFSGADAQGGDSAGEFRALLDASETVLELDGRRDGGDPYGACGSVVVENADVLIVVWDGERQRLEGGTEAALDLALERSIPVLWVPVREPERWGLLRAAEDLPRPGVHVPPAPGAAEEVHAIVRQVLCLPGTPLDRTPAPLEAFLRETMPARSFAIAWRVFNDLVGEGRWPSLRTRLEPLASTAQDASDEDRLARHYEWANRLAMLYADRYRSAFVVCYLLAAFAVAMALLPIGLHLQPHGSGELVCAALELLSILGVVVLVVRGRMQRWHERWIDYRLVAESLRQLRLTTPIEGARPMPSTPGHQSEYGPPSEDWTGWYVRSVERSLKLPHAVLDDRAVDGSIERLLATLEEQARFHGRAAHLAHVTEHRLHLGGMLLLGVTLVACALHLVAAPLHLSVAAGHALTFLCGFLPALGAALAGIAYQGEFRRLMRRSRAMEQALGQLAHRARAIRASEGGALEAHHQRSRLVAALANSASQVMLQELLDWRVVFLDQPLRPPS